jgi:hypothetical protein
MYKKAHTLTILAGITLTLFGPAQAALIDRGSGLLYDDVLNITWLQDANYAQTSGYDADGRMTFSAANTWVANLSYAGYNDWRLPTMTDTGTPGCNAAYSGTDCGYNVDTAFSELAYMYYNNLGLKSYRDASGITPADWGIFSNGTYNGTDTSSFGANNVGLVQNLQASEYWSGIPYAPNPFSTAWAFDTSIGDQYNRVQYYGSYAWAVRNGDVAVLNPAPVPVPVLLVLVATGLFGLLGWKYKR